MCAPTAAFPIICASTQPMPTTTTFGAAPIRPSASSRPTAPMIIQGRRRPNRLVVRSLRRPKMGSKKSELKAPSEVMMPSVATTSCAATSSCSFRVRPALRGVASAAMTPKRARIIVITTRAGAFSLGGGIRGPPSTDPP